MKQIYGSNSRSALSLVLIISIGIHFVALFVFGAFKIVESITREEKTFEAPPIEPAPEVPPEPVNLVERNQQSAPPRPNPIVVDSPLDVDLPALDIDLNVVETSAYGRGQGGFGTGSGMSDIREMAINLTDFGYSGFVEGALEGTLFDTKRDEDGDPLIEMDRVDVNAVNDWLTPRMQKITYEFTSGTWNIRQLEREYLAAKKKLYASYLYIPQGPAAKAPEAFNAQDEIQPVSIIAYYEGTFVPQESGSFRFVGKGDDALIVRANNRLVFDGSLNNQYSEYNQNEHGRWPGILMDRDDNNVGDWMRWTEGNAIDLEILIAEAPGGVFFAYLFVQKKGEDGLRIFSTKPLSEEEKERLRRTHPDIAKLL